MGSLGLLGIPRNLGSGLLPARVCRCQHPQALCAVPHPAFVAYAFGFEITRSGLFVSVDSGTGLANQLLTKWSLVSPWARENRSSYQAECIEH